MGISPFPFFVGGAACLVRGLFSCHSTSMTTVGRQCGSSIVGQLQDEVYGLSCRVVLSRYVVDAYLAPELRDFFGGLGWGMVGQKQKQIRGCPCWTVPYSFEL